VTVEDRDDLDERSPTDRGLRLKSERMATRLRLMSELTREFARSTGDYHALLDLIARRLGETVGEACVIRVVPERGDSFETVEGLYHPDPEFREQWRHHLHTQAQRTDEGLTGRALTTGQSILIATTTPAALSVGLERHRTIIERLAVRSVMAVPLHSEGKPIGVATMTRSDPENPYTQEDLQLLEDLASHASIAITNAILLGTARRELAERKRAETALIETQEQLLQATADRAADFRPESGPGRHGKDEPAAGGRGRPVQDGPRKPAGQGQGRSRTHRADDHEPGRQRARRDANKAVS
jgi:GAF domain-containing protein